MLEDALEYKKQLWRFQLKTLNVKRKGGTKGFPLLSSEQVFTVGLFIGLWRLDFFPDHFQS
jgi:hypothetical protein